MTIKLEGGRQLEAALKELGSTISSRLASNATRAGARVILTRAKQLVPVRTGALKASLRVSTDRSERGNTRTAYVGSRARHAHLVEFGSVRTPARSFLRSAADEAAQAAVDKLTENLGRGIERETAKYRGR